MSLVINKAARISHRPSGPAGHSRRADRYTPKPGIPCAELGSNRGGASGRAAHKLIDERASDHRISRTFGGGGDDVGRCGYFSGGCISPHSVARINDERRFRSPRQPAALASRPPQREARRRRPKGAQLDREARVAEAAVGEADRPGCNRQAALARSRVAARGPSEGRSSPRASAPAFARSPRPLGERSDHRSRPRRREADRVRRRCGRRNPPPPAGTLNALHLSAAAERFRSTPPALVTFASFE
jgi:hypothetical protein